MPGGVFATEHKERVSKSSRHTPRAVAEASGMLRFYGEKKCASAARGRLMKTENRCDELKLRERHTEYAYYFKKRKSQWGDCRGPLAFRILMGAERRIAQQENYLAERPRFSIMISAPGVMRRSLAAKAAFSVALAFSALRLMMP